MSKDITDIDLFGELKIYLDSRSEHLKEIIYNLELEIQNLKREKSIIAKRLEEGKIDLVKQYLMI